MRLAFILSETLGSTAKEKKTDSLLIVTLHTTTNSEKDTQKSDPALSYIIAFLIALRKIVFNDIPEAILFIFLIFRNFLHL